MSKKTIDNPTPKAPTTIPDAWKTMDLEQALKRDLTACVSLMSLILNDPSIFAVVWKALEDHRQLMIKKSEEEAE